MAEVVENQERTFKHYLQLPEDIRKFVINEQKPDDRVRFTRCSKLCNQEAKASKNFIVGLTLSSASENYMAIQVEYGRFLVDAEGPQKCEWFYFEESGQIVKLHRSTNSQWVETEWQEVLNGSTNMVEYAIGEFINLLQRYQKTIKSLRLIGTFENVDFGVDSLDRLEDLIIEQYDIRKIFPKLRRPLKNLSVDNINNISILSHCEELYQVQNSIDAKDLKLDKQQFLRLSADSFALNIGTLTERDVFEIIRSWQNGTMRKPVISYQWHLKNSNFDLQKLAKLLRVDENELDLGEDDLEIEVKHFNEPGY